MARKRRQKSGRRDALVGAFFGIIGLAAIGLLIWGSLWSSKSRIELDADTNCPVRGPSAVHVILIDRSDPITPQQGQQIRQIFDSYFAKARTGERFDLYVASGDAVNVLTPVASVCSPGRGDQVSELTANPQMVQRKFDEKFIAVLRDNLQRLLATSTAETSPILESIRAAAVSSFGALEPGQMPLQMTVVSDLVQHSAANSHFRGETGFSDLSKRPAWRLLQANLKGASVNFLYLARPSAVRNGQLIQSRGHQHFWEEAIKSSGGTVTGFSSL